MNESIRALLDKATYDVLGVKQVDQKQFAKLIIRECINTLYQHGWADAADDMKKHFGVEE